MRYIRKLWLRDSATNKKWDLTPDDPQSDTGWMYGTPLISVSGMGFEQTIDQTQINIEYFINQVKSKNVKITGTLHFFSDRHVEAFKNFIGDTKKQFQLHYSPDGKISAGDDVSKSWYKPVVISAFKKGEKDKFGNYQIPIEFTSQSDAWKRDNFLEFDPVSSFGDAHIYPYFYPYVYSGKTALATNITNFGSETYPIVRITSNSGIISNPEWYSEHIIADALGNKNTEYQRGKWNLEIGGGEMLEVDSRPMTQHAYLYHAQNNIENVRSLEEPDYRYIGYISLKNGNSRLVFNIDNVDNVKIAIEYQELSEIV